MERNPAARVYLNTLKLLDDQTNNVTPKQTGFLNRRAENNPAGEYDPQSSVLRYFKKVRDARDAFKTSSTSEV